ncbi:MAG: hypothetical protein RL095_3079 [Verrucomicrobiota bacterium]
MSNKRPLNALGCRSLRWIGGFLLLIALVFGVKHAVFVSHAIKTNAVVSEMKKSYGKGSRYSIRPAFYFFDQQGRIQHGQTSISSSDWDFQIGSHIPVYYDPADPNNNEIDCFKTLWLLPCLFGFIGLVILIIGIFHPASSMRRKS